MTRLEAILDELRSLDPQEQNETTIGLLREALTLVDRRDDTERWASLVTYLASCLARQEPGCREESIELLLSVTTTLNAKSLPVEWATAHAHLASLYAAEENSEVRMIMHARRAMRVFRRGEHPTTWADLQLILTSALRALDEGNGRRIHRAIRGLKAARSIYRVNESWQRWGQAQHNLANAYASGLVSNPARNRQRAAIMYRQVLKVHTKESNPMYWAMTCRSLGLLYESMTELEEESRLQAAISCYESALSVEPEGSQFYEFDAARRDLEAVVAQLQQLEQAKQASQQAGGANSTLMSAASHIRHGQSVLEDLYAASGDLDQALPYFRQAVDILESDVDSGEAASLLNHTGFQLLSIGSLASLRQAIRAFQLVADTYKGESNNEWARAMHNIGESQRRLAEADIQLLYQAIESLEAANTVFNREETPRDWGLAEHSIGASYLTIASDTDDHEQRESLLNQALLHLENALSVRFRDEEPAFWVRTTSGIGIATYELFRIERAPELLKTARICLESTLDVVVDALTPERPQVLFVLAEIAEHEGEADQAIAYLNQSLDDYDQLGMHAEWLQAMTRLTAGYRVRGLANNSAPDLELAESYGTKVIHDPTASPHEQAFAQYLVAGAVVDLLEYHDVGDTEQCVHALEVAIAAANLHGERSLEAMLFHRLGSFHFQAKRFELAADALEKALQFDLSESSIEAGSIANAHSYLGEIYFELGLGKSPALLDQSLAHFESALAASSQPDVESHMVFDRTDLLMLTSVANAERLMDDHTDNSQRAIDQLREVKSVVDRDESPGRWATLHHNLGNAYMGKGTHDPANVELAISCFEEALTVQEENTTEWAETQNSLAWALMNRPHSDQLSNLEQATSCYQRALRVFTPTKHADDWAMVQHNLGSALVESNPQLAVRHLEAALHVRTREKMPIYWAMTHMMLANAYLAIGSADDQESARQAIAHAKQAQELYTSSNSPTNWVGCNLILAQAHAYLGEFESARRVVEAAILESDTQEQIETQVKSRLALARIVLRSSGLERTEEVRVILREVLGLMPSDTFPKLRRETLYMLGGVDFVDERWSAAVDSYDEFLEMTWHDLEASLTLSTQTESMSSVGEASQRLGFALAKVGRFLDATVAWESGQALLLRRSLATDSAIDELTPEDRTEAIKRKKRISLLESELRTPVEFRPTRAKNFDIISELAEHHQRLSEMVAVDESMSTKKVSGLLRELPADYCVAMCVTLHGALAFVFPTGIDQLTADEAVWIPELNGDWLLDLLYGKQDGDGPSWLESCAARKTHKEIPAWRDMIHETCRELGSVMAPIADRLTALGADKESLVGLVAPGELGLLPISASLLQDAEGERVFGQMFTVTMAPSLSILDTCARRFQAMSRKEPRLFAVADPTGDLPFSGEECRSISRLFDKATVLAGDESIGLERFSGDLSKATHFHFAGHAYFNWREPLASRLLLAQDRGIALHDLLVSARFMDCQLVVLSACETGIRAVRSDSGNHIGMATAFINCGAAAVVSTLWAVDDVSTWLLIDEFYQRSKEVGSASALRQALDWLRNATAGKLAARFKEERKKATKEPNLISPAVASSAWRRMAALPKNEKPFSSPYYWAAFTVTGF